MFKNHCAIPNWATRREAMSNPSSRYYPITLIAFSSPFTNCLIPGICVLSILLDLRQIFRVLIVKHGFYFQISLRVPCVFLTFIFVKEAGSPHCALEFCFGCVLLCPSALIQYQSQSLCFLLPSRSYFRQIWKIALSFCWLLFKSLLRLCKHQSFS